MTQDDLLYRFRPRVFAIAAELGTVRAAGRAMGIIPRHITAGSGSWTATARRSWGKAPAATCRCQDRAGEMRFLTPANLVDLAEAIPARYRALVFVGAYGGLRIGELAGLRQSRVDLLAGAVTVAEILTESKGKLIAGPPNTRPKEVTVRAGHTSVSFTLAAAATRRSPGRSGRAGAIR